MNAEIKKWASQKDFLMLQYSVIIAIISTAMILFIDVIFFRLAQYPFFDRVIKLIGSIVSLNFNELNQLYNPLTFIQFYGILFIVVFGLIAGLLFYREEKEVSTEEVSEFRTKMEQKKLKKAKKIKGRSR
ncbi:MAG: hypothetical protein K8R08_05295 [Methanosarcinales archaeon]|nr:hypothetical protein [Methanosarcinales archaeon]